jgi:hypothetical protein
METNTYLRLHSTISSFLTYLVALFESPLSFQILSLYSLEKVFL